MAASAAQLAKRALVTVLLSLAAVYKLVIAVKRDSTDAEVVKAFRRVAIKAHPDKGGCTADFARLSNARDKWDAAKKECKKNNGKGGRPQREEPQPETANGLADPDAGRKEFRIDATAVLLTYHGFEDVQHWRRFVRHVEQNQGPWKVKHWCATLEATKKGGLHVHCMLQFSGRVDRCSRFFTFEGLAPRADPCDLLGEGFCRNKMQQSINRAMFYCFVDKLGTQRDEEGEVCVAGNYWPCWVESAAKTYSVLGKWNDSLWKARKLEHQTYESYAFACRDGVLFRKRNLDAVREHEEEQAERKEMEAVIKRIRLNFSKPFPKLAAAEAWLATFKAEVDRYAFLVVLGPSRAGKTEWAKSLFARPLELKVGALEQFPDGMRAFARTRYDGIVLDDIRDFAFLVAHQDKLQSKYDNMVEFGTTPGGQCAYHRWLWRIPVVVTANFTTKNKALLESDDFLGNPGNRVVVNYSP